jgi:streptomycin 6-kinase
MPHIDERLAEIYAQAAEENDRTPSAVTPEHKSTWLGDERTRAIQTPKAAPLNQARAQSALAAVGVQMQAAEPEKEGNLFMQWHDGRGLN